VSGKKGRRGKGDGYVRERRHEEEGKGLTGGMKGVGGFKRKGVSTVLFGPHCTRFNCHIGTTDSLSSAEFLEKVCDVVLREASPEPAPNRTAIEEKENAEKEKEHAGIVKDSTYVWKIERNYILEKPSENFENTDNPNMWLNPSSRCSNVESGGGFKYITTALSFFVLCWKLGDVVNRMCRKCVDGSLQWCIWCCIWTCTLVFGFGGFLAISIAFGRGGVYLSTCRFEKVISQMSIAFTTLELIAIFVGWCIQETDADISKDTTETSIPCPSDGGEETGADKSEETRKLSSCEKITKCKKYYNLIQDGVSTIIDFADTVMDVIRINEHTCAGFSGNVAEWILATLVVNAVSVFLFLHCGERELIVTLSGLQPLHSSVVVFFTGVDLFIVVCQSMSVSLSRLSVSVSARSSLYPTPPAAVFFIFRSIGRVDARALPLHLTFCLDLSVLSEG